MLARSTGLAAALLSLSLWATLRSGPAEPVALMLLGLQALAVAALWGQTLGSLLQAYWPAAPGTPPDPAHPQVRPPLTRPVARRLVNVPVGLCLMTVAAALVLIRPWTDPAVTAQATALKLREVLQSRGWQPVACPPAPHASEAPARCVGVMADGPTAWPQLLAVLNDQFGSVNAERSRNGGLMMGTLPVPVTPPLGRGGGVEVSFFGLTFSPEQPPSSSLQDWLAQQLTPSIVRLETP
ncbi:hypothetical protein C8263_11275 [Deinococcus arcticus]|uniref:Uncharacterized protein n=2 Tax=Deinococcus arcticus TaxID=2136176 RepID=A0A2T3W733_9DEIO|nr:hypothetical protein C8263_11275 [Deinococcus arcticus]